VSSGGEGAKNYAGKRSRGSGKVTKLLCPPKRQDCSLGNHQGHLSESTFNSISLRQQQKFLQMEIKINDNGMPRSSLGYTNKPSGTVTTI
jgi:hypothetical protein